MKRLLVGCLSAAVIVTEGAAFAAPPASPLAQMAAQADGDQNQAPIVMHLGHGKPQSTVIFMHGLDGKPEGHEGLLRDLLTPREGAVKVVAIWMRPENGPHTMTDQLARARKAIDSEPGPVFLMGHSFGGKAALKLVAEYPKDKVQGIIALAPSVNMLQSYWKRLTGERQLPSHEIVDPHLAKVETALAAKVGQLSKNDDSDSAKSLRHQLTYVRVMRDLTRHDEPGTEAGVKRPTLVFHGTEDEAVSIHYARRFATQNPEAVRMVELPSVKHGFELTPHVAQSMGNQIHAFIAEQKAAAPIKAPVMSPHPVLNPAPAPPQLQHPRKP